MFHMFQEHSNLEMPICSTVSPLEVQGEVLVTTETIEIDVNSFTSSIPTSSSAASMYSSILDEPKTKRSRISSQQSHRDRPTNLMAAAEADEKQFRPLTRASRSSSSAAASLNTEQHQREREQRDIEHESSNFTQREPVS